MKKLRCVRHSFVTFAKSDQIVLTQWIWEYVYEEREVDGYSYVLDPIAGIVDDYGNLFILPELYYFINKTVVVYSSYHKG